MARSSCFCDNDNSSWSDRVTSTTRRTVGVDGEIALDSSPCTGCIVEEDLHGEVVGCESSEGRHLQGASLGCHQGQEDPNQDSDVDRDQVVARYSGDVGVRSSTDRAFDFGSKGWGFESLRARHGDGRIGYVRRASVLLCAAALALSACGTESTTTANEVIPTPKKAADLSIQRRHSCVLTDAGAVECWGLNAFERLGDGTRVNRDAPSKVQFADNVKVTALSKGLSDHVCGIADTGDVWCWGVNVYGQLGSLELYRHEEPVQVQGLPDKAVQAATSEHSTCAVLADASVWCWGNNNNTTLGQPTDRVPGVNKPGSMFPIKVPGLGAVRSLASGGNHYCVLEDGNVMKCWGDNKYGQLGIGTDTQVVGPRDVKNLPGVVTEMSLGQSHTCVLLDVGSVWCWGANQHDQVGRESQIIPGEVPFLTGPTTEVALGAPAQAITAGRYFVCATMMDASLKCWGKIRGDDDETNVVTTDLDYSQPVGIAGAVNIAQADAGSRHVCYRDLTAHVFCFGMDDFGQAGNGPGISEGVAVTPVVGYDR